MSSRGDKGRAAIAARARAKAIQTLLRGTKTCNQCRRELPLAAYPERLETLDGRKGSCRECETLRLLHRYLDEKAARRKARQLRKLYEDYGRVLAGEAEAFLREEPQFGCCTPAYSEGQWVHDRACFMARRPAVARKLR